MAASQIWHKVGKKYIGDIFNKAVTPVSTLYLLLRQLDGSGGHPADAAEADTLASNLSEVTTTSTGYARQAVTNNATNFPNTYSSNDALLTAAAQTFSFTGAGLPVNGITHAAWSTTSDNAGTLICSAPLSVTRNVAEGDQIVVTFSMLFEHGA